MNMPNVTTMNNPLPPPLAVLTPTPRPNASVGSPEHVQVLTRLAGTSNQPGTDLPTYCTPPCLVNCDQWEEVRLPQLKGAINWMFGCCDYCCCLYSVLILIAPVWGFPVENTGRLTSGASQLQWGRASPAKTVHTVEMSLSNWSEIWSAVNKNTTEWRFICSDIVLHTGTALKLNFQSLSPSQLASLISVTHKM